MNIDVIVKGIKAKVEEAEKREDQRILLSARSYADKEGVHRKIDAACGCELDWLAVTIGNLIGDICHEQDADLREVTLLLTIAAVEQNKQRRKEAQS